MYKGGPNTGVFLQITSDDADDVNMPGQKYTFGVVKEAQARATFSCWQSAVAECCGFIWAQM